MFVAVVDLLELFDLGKSDLEFGVEAVAFEKQLFIPVSSVLGIRNPGTNLCLQVANCLVPFAQGCRILGKLALNLDNTAIQIVADVLARTQF